MARRERVADCHDICFLPITDALCTLTRSSFRVATPSHTAPCRILLWVAQAHPFPSCHLWGGPHLRELTAIGLRDNLLRQERQAWTADATIQTPLPGLYSRRNPLLETAGIESCHRSYTCP